MKTKEDIKKIAIGTIQAEYDAIKGLRNAVNDDFTGVVELILAGKGRVVITGMGKSAIIANKIVSTLNSTGTPAIFMHAADAIHGDLGIIQEDDLVIPFQVIFRYFEDVLLDDLGPFRQMIAEPEEVQDVYFVAAFQQFRGEHRADIACPARNQYLHGGLLSINEIVGIFGLKPVGQGLRLYVLVG